MLPLHRYKFQSPGLPCKGQRGNLSSPQERRPSAAVVSGAPMTPSEGTPLMSQPIQDIKTELNRCLTPQHANSIVSPNRQVAMSSSRRRHNQNIDEYDDLNFSSSPPNSPQADATTTDDSPLTVLTEMLRKMDEGVKIQVYTQDSGEGIMAKLYLTEDDVLKMFRDPRCLCGCLEKPLFEAPYGTITGFTTSVSVEGGIIVQAGPTNCARFRIDDDDDQVNNLVDFLADTQGSNITEKEGGGFIRFSEAEIDRHLRERKKAPLQPVRKSTAWVYPLLGKLLACVIGVPYIVRIIADTFNIGIPADIITTFFIAVGIVVGIIEFISHLRRTADEKYSELEEKVYALYSRWHQDQANYEESEDLKIIMLEFAETYGLLPAHKRRGCIRKLCKNVDKVNKALDLFETDNRLIRLFTATNQNQREMQNLLLEVRRELREVREKQDSLTSLFASFERLDWLDFRRRTGWIDWISVRN